MPRVTVVGLGPAGPDLVTEGTSAAIRSIPTRFVRTTRHPAVVSLGEVTSFDSLYDASPTLEAVYGTIVEALITAAGEHGHILYAVPGSPAVAERTVELLRADARIEVDVVPALSCVDLAWVRLGVDPLDEGARIVDGHRFATDSAGERGPLLVLQCDQPHVLSDIKLAFDDASGDGPGAVTVLQRLGLSDEAVFTVAWDDLDRIVVPDHLTSLWIPELAVPVGRELVRFAELVRTLRERCPWDRQQTHLSLTRHLLEETYEVLEAIESLGEGEDGGWDHLCEELGDLLFQVYFHTTLAAEQGQFTLADVARGIHDKLVRRHPHVFGGDGAATASQVVTNWEQIKRQEKGRNSLMDGIPGALPSLLYAHKVQRKAASVGFDWEDVEGAYPKVIEELDELRRAAGTGAAPDGTPSAAEIAMELGDLLFACVNVARHLDVDPESALRGATGKFRVRFMAVEALAAERGIDMVVADLSTLDGLWDEAKKGLGGDT